MVHHIKNPGYEIMKIIVFYQYFCTPKGSWSTRIYELTRRWVKEGHQVTVVTAPYEKSDIVASGFISNQVIDGINIKVINSSDSNRVSKVKRAYSAIKFALVASYFGLTAKYDVLISSSGPITVGIPLLLAKTIRRKKCVFEIRDLWPDGGIEAGLIKNKTVIKLLKWFERKCYSSAEVIVTASEGQTNHIKASHPDFIVETIPNASDNELFSSNLVNKDVSNKDKIVLSHIGSIGLLHNVKYWIDLATRFMNSDYSQKFIFRFIGDGADRKPLEALAKERRLTNVEFIGLVPKDDLPLWLSNSDATIFATLDNPVQDTCSPNKIFDSFAAGKPIIQTSKGWIKDLVEQECCGLNISLDDIEHSFNSVVEFCLNQELLLESGLNAKRMAESKFDRGRLAYKYLDILTDITKES